VAFGSGHKLISKPLLDGIQATEEELKLISAHVLALQNILLKDVVLIDKADDLKKAGVRRRRLVF
jgi:hypothetical protein